MDDPPIERPDRGAGPDEMPEPADEASPLLEALAEYLRHDGSRSEAERRSLLEAHPDLRDELASFLDDEAAVFGVASSGLSDGIAGPRDEAETSFAFGGYDVQGPIARGGMGVVFLARELRLNRLVALKILPGGGFAPPQDRRRFQREAELVAALDHPHIVPVYAVGEHAGHAYLAMKLVAGGSLAAHLDVFRGDPRGAASLLRQVALAVQHAHERGVLHLDLKPSNVLLEGDGRPLVADFGLARRAGHGAELTWTGAVVGTPGYMAPEQASGRREEVSAATDVYGLGALLYALLTGRPPFVGDTPAEVIDRVRHGEPLPPCRLARGIPPDLEAITLCCLERDPAARYATAQEVADDMERHLTGLPVHARTRPAFVRLGKYLGRRRGRVALVLTVALVGVLAVVAAIESRRASEQQQATARLAIEINRGQGGPGPRRLRHAFSEPPPASSTRVASPRRATPSPASSTRALPSIRPRAASNGPTSAGRPSRDRGSPGSPTRDGRSTTSSSHATAPSWRPPAATARAASGRWSRAWRRPRCGERSVSPSAT
ncbi:MAG: protein kinase [Isosphaeraceae bacterium]